MAKRPASKALEPSRTLGFVPGPRIWFSAGIALATFLLLGLWANVMAPVLRGVDWLAGPKGHIQNTIFEGVGGALLALDMAVAMLGLFHAVGLLWGCVIGLWCWERRGRPVLAGALALMIALGGNGLIAAYSARFLTVPAGASIRPMPEAVWMMMASLYTIAAVAGLTIFAGARERGWSWLWAALACPIALESFLLGGQLLRWAAAVNHFTLSD